jgi:hypothetical protein
MDHTTIEVKSRAKSKRTECQAAFVFAVKRLQLSQGPVCRCGVRQTELQTRVNGTARSPLRAAALTE